MLQNKDLDSIAERLALTLPPGVHALKDELRDNFRAVLASNLERLDLVSRDQFEAQAALLSRTATQLKALEARLAELESAARQT